MSTSGWLQTPLHLQQGDTFEFLYLEGTWTVDYPDLPYVQPPDGYPPDIDSTVSARCKYDTSFPYGTLLAQIGSGAVFAIGWQWNYTANASGILSLRINDKDDCLGDNNGPINVNFTGPDEGQPPPPTPGPTPPPPHVNQSPVIKLRGGNNPLELTQGCPFDDPGATANDPEDGDLTKSITRSGNPKITVPGKYRRQYSVTDSEGSSVVKTRTVIVSAPVGTVVCFSDKPKRKAPNLIVLVHGCCTDANGVKEWDALRDTIRDQLESTAPDNDKWELVVWNWTNSTPTELLHNWTLNFSEAYNGALQSGVALAGRISDPSNKPYDYVHLISHSAGARLIHVASLCLRMLESKPGIAKKEKDEVQDALRKSCDPSSKSSRAGYDGPFLHLTFLDAYTYRVCVKRGPRGGCIESIDDKDQYGSAADFAEHYVDMSGPPGTDAILMQAFNFDITKLGKSGDDNACIDRFNPPLFPPSWKNHQWPRCWYANSIEFPGSGGYYGYTISREAGNGEYKTLRDRFRPGNSCKLQDVRGECGTDAP